MLATFQVTVCDELPASDTAVLGAVTENGPDVLVTSHCHVGKIGFAQWL